MGLTVPNLQAAMSLQSNFPRTRKYYFWAIFLSQLTATDAKSSEAERKLFGTLAYRMASKAADNVPTDTVCLLHFPLVSVWTRAIGPIGVYNNGLFHIEGTLEP